MCTTSRVSRLSYLTPIAAMIPLVLSFTATLVAKEDPAGLDTYGRGKEIAGGRWEKIQPGWFEWVMPWGEHLKPSALNMSHLLDKPAGKHGFVRSVENQFQFEDGTRARFWGACIGYQEAMPQAKYAPAMAEWIAFNGWNCVREHFSQYIFSADYALTTPAGDHSAPDPVQLDRFDRLNAELRKRGIYYHWLPFAVTNMNFNSKDGAVRGVSAGVCFDEISFRLQERFLRQMLTHRNPYTGLRYADDPAMSGIELHNEWVFRVRAEKEYDPALWRELVGLWAGWLRERYGDDKALRAAWKDVKLGPDESLAAGTIRFPGSKQKKFDSRNFAERAFSGWILQRYCDRLTRFMRALGLKVPVSPSNLEVGYFYLKAMANSGFSGSHSYHSHPSSWRPLVVGSQTRLNIRFADFRPERFLNEARTADVPMSAGEVGTAAPSDYRHEAILSLAANSCLQDYDMFLWFISFFYPQAYEDPGTRALRAAHGLNFDPSYVGPMPAAALMVHRQDVSPAENVVEILANDEVQRYLHAGGIRKNLEYPRNYQYPSLEWVPFLTRQRINFQPDKPTPGAILLNPDPALGGKLLEHKVIGGPVEKLSEPLLAELKRRSPRFRLTGPGSGVSDTGQLAYDRGAGVMIIDTPRTQALIGNLASGRRILSAVTIDSSNDAATICVSSLDGLPLRRASRMLVTCIADSANEGMDLRVPPKTPKDGRPSQYEVRSWGWPTKRLMCEPVTARVTIRLDRTRTRVNVYRLDAAGQRMGPIEYEIDNRELSIAPSAPYKTLYYEIVLVY